MAILLKSDGTRQELNPANGKTFTLKEMQAAVGGWVEVVRMPDGRLMLVNEEGKLEGLPYNAQATMLFNPALVMGVGGGDYIVGNALICKKEDID